MEFQLSCFKSYKMMLWKCCTQYPSTFGKLSSGHRTGKGQLSFQSQIKAMPKNAQTTSQLHSSHTLAKRCSKFSKLGFNSMWTENFQMSKLDLEKAEEPEIKSPTSIGSQKKQESSRKTTCFIDYTKTFDCVSHNKLWKILQEKGIPDHLTASWVICVQVKMQYLELDMEQWTGSKLGKEYIKAVYCHPAYLTYIQSTSCEIPGWMKHSWNQDCQGIYQ